MELYSEANVGKELNVSGVVLVSEEFSTGAAVTTGWNLFQELEVLDTILKFNYTFVPRYTRGNTEANIINTVSLQ